MLRKDVRVNRGDHHIIDPIEDERRLLDFLQPAVALALFLLSPRLDGDRLSLGDGGTGLRIAIVLAPAFALRKGTAYCLACLRRGEEEALDHPEMLDRSV